MYWIGREPRVSSAQYPRPPCLMQNEIFKDAVAWFIYSKYGSSNY